MEMKQLRSFAAVVKYQSFTKAAEALYASQPTVSAHIRQMEEELHTKLVLRTTKNVEITPKGMELYEYAETILGLHDRMIECCSEEHKKVIHVGASTIPSAYILPNILPEYEKRHPDVSFFIHQGDSQGVIAGLLDNLFDVGLIGMHSDEDALTCIPFYRDRMVIVTPVNDHFLALRQQAVSIRELLREPVILREKGSGSKKSADSLLESLGITEADLLVTARVNDQETIKNLVAGGLGISILSEMAARNFVDAGRVLQFEFPDMDSGRTLYLAYRKNYILRSSVQSFVKFIGKYFEK
jgi:DNA-binding transcriptional LysR family regulator